MSSLLLVNKPFHVLSQFTDSEGRITLAKYVNETDYYPAGRLDYDSEGLLILTNDGALQARIADPKHKLPKHYWVQVEGQLKDRDLIPLREGLMLNDGKTRPAQAQIITHPPVWERMPPIRERANQPTTWIELIIKEGRNRQVRRMTAAIGHPTLRLIRHKIGPWSLKDMQPGESRKEKVHLPTPSAPVRKQTKRAAHPKRQTKRQAR